MDAKLRAQLDVIGTTAGAYAKANLGRRQDYDWITPNEESALANLRASLGELARLEEKALKGRAA